jgi:hypothetical protein
MAPAVTPLAAYTAGEGKRPAFGPQLSLSVSQIPYEGDS